MRWWRFAIAMGVLLVGCSMAGPAFADSCGDPDRSGATTVTDGVNVLRHAAGLDGPCSDDPGRCDVDGSGAVTVTDGVNVLRRAAGLAVDLRCPSGDDVSRFAGRYQGTFSGDDDGDFDVDVDCEGDIDGVGYSSSFDEDFDVFGSVTASGDVTITGGTSSVSTFRGTIRADGTVSGTWRNDFEHADGSFRGARTSTPSCP